MKRTGKYRIKQEGDLFYPQFQAKSLFRKPYWCYFNNEEVSKDSFISLSFPNLKEAKEYLDELKPKKVTIHKYN